MIVIYLWALFNSKPFKTFEAFRKVIAVTKNLFSVPFVRHPLWKQQKKHKKQSCKKASSHFLIPAFLRESARLLKGFRFLFGCRIKNEWYFWLKGSWHFSIVISMNFVIWKDENDEIESVEKMFMLRDVRCGRMIQVFNLLYCNFFFLIFFHSFLLTLWL